jgi:hypothetical protein
LADNYSKELDKLFGTDSECENDYSDISSECNSDFSVQDEDNLEQAGVTENTEPKQGETRNADHDENSSVHFLAWYISLTILLVCLHWLFS